MKFTKDSSVASRCCTRSSSAGSQFEVARGHPQVPEKLPAAGRSVKEASQALFRGGGVHGD